MAEAHLRDYVAWRVHFVAPTSREEFEAATLAHASLGQRSPEAGIASPPDDGALPPAEVLSQTPEVTLTCLMVRGSECCICRLHFGTKPSFLQSQQHHRL